MVYAIIDERRTRPADTNTGDLLWMLLSARDEETGEGMSDQQVRDEVMTLRLVPGHPVEPHVLPTLQPRYGLPMTLHSRLTLGTGDGRER